MFSGSCHCYGTFIDLHVHVHVHVYRTCGLDLCNLLVSTLYVGKRL